MKWSYLLLNLIVIFVAERNEESNQNLLFISPLIRHVIIVCISNIIPIAKGCFICINIILNINNFLISGSCLIKINILTFYIWGHFFYGEF
jgi:hypothetical protein